MGIKEKRNCILWGLLKNLIFSVESQEGNGVLGQFADLRGHLAKILGGVFEEDWYPNARYEKLNHRLTGFFLGVIL